MISGSSSSSLYNIPDQSQQTASVYSLTSSIDTGFQLRNGSLNISINGVDLSSEQNQLQSGSVDFFISSSQQEFLVRKPTVEDPFHGHNIDKTEFLTIRFQQEKGILMAQNYLKGVKHEFIKPVSESKFGGDVLVFRDSDKNPIEYSMNMRSGD